MARMQSTEVSSRSSPRSLPPREWRIREPATAPDFESNVERLVRETGLSRLAIQVCIQRGLSTQAEIETFLNPRLESLKDPFSIRDMPIAVERLAQARDSQEKVRVFGDYDVDGTTGSALLHWVFRDFGFLDSDVRQPDRFKDGYGLNPGAVEEAVAEGVKVLVTVDCGITSFAAAERARELGLELIVVDHHQIDPNKGLPPALAVVNPQRADCESGLRQLCGCGLAFYVARALRAEGRKREWWPAGQEPNLKQHLDLVVIATAADLVPLTGDNHILVRHGLEVLRGTKKPGVRALLDAAGLSSKEISPGHLGFTLGPRINASGRMGSASLAQNLLTTFEPGEAARLAFELERMNRERAELQNRIWDDVRARIEVGIAAGRFRHGIVVADESWHEGVVGIVASRVTETFRKPAAVIAIREGHGKGSVRTFGGKDILSALRNSAEFLAGFGGHRHAAGLSLLPENLDLFAASFDEAVAQLEEEKGGSPIFLEGEAELTQLDVRTITELERLGPFGPGNPEPVFSVSAEVLSHQLIKGRHLKLQLGNPNGGKGRLEGIWFHAAEKPEYMSGELLKGRIQLAGVPELNRFRGNVTPNLRVKDGKPLSN
jgi:single-stranded-DNA-specific exonuclease